MKTGILGGTFDPIHNGHIAVAEAVLHELGLDRVLLMPTGKPPYRKCRAKRRDRFAMVEIAARDHAGLCPCDVEINREGKTYTVDTLKTLHEMYPEDEFTYILGMDALEALPDWYKIGKIVKLASFAVAGRPGWNREEAIAQARVIEAEFGASIAVTESEGPAISSAQVRERVALGMDISQLTDAGVAEYIREKGLYLCDYTEDALLKRLRETVTLHRYHHTLGVADTAERLAPKCGVDPKRARLAGLLHDCAKSLPYGEMRELVAEFVPDTDEIELESEPVLHAPAGMVVARRDYGVRDPAILQAIRRHTLGDGRMSPMDALIYVADFIEPGRKSFEGLEQAREAAETDIYEAMRICARLTTDYLVAHGKAPNPRTQRLLDEN